MIIIIKAAVESEEEKNADGTCVIIQARAGAQPLSIAHYDE